MLKKLFGPHSRMTPVQREDLHLGPNEKPKSSTLKLKVDRAKKKVLHLTSHSEGLK